MTVRGALVLALFGLLAVPGQAGAFFASVQDGVVQFHADPGDGTQVVDLSGSAGTYRLHAAAYTGSAIEHARLGPGCRDATRHDVTPSDVAIVCDAPGARGIDVALGDGDDIFAVGSVDVPLTYSGGDGRDEVSYYGVGPVGVSNDDVANDGPAGRDNILPDVEKLSDTSGSDVLVAGPNATELDVVRGGGDTARGGPADDVIRSAQFPAVRDTVSCGGGHDVAVADRLDRVARDCEIVGRDDGSASVFTGSQRADRLALRGLVADRTRVYMGAGNDHVDARDGTNDVIHCGSGRDLVWVDGHDRVTKDCERVVRP